jgi:hypothetical protein
LRDQIRSFVPPEQRMCLACLFEDQRPGQYQHGATPHERWATKGKGLKARSRLPGMLRAFSPLSAGGTSFHGALPHAGMTTRRWRSQM